MKEKPSSEIIDLEGNVEVSFSFEKLLNSFKKDFNEDMITLLFYSFLQENQNFSNYLLAIKDPYTFVIYYFLTIVTSYSFKIISRRCKPKSFIHDFNNFNDFDSKF